MRADVLDGKGSVGMSLLEEREDLMRLDQRKGAGASADNDGAFQGLLLALIRIKRKKVAESLGIQMAVRAARMIFQTYGGLV
jgi:hypothetical protein